MKRRFCFLILSILLSLPLFSHEGSLAGAGKLRVSQTKYFDIIYSEKNLETARILYENADALFEEITAAYQIDPYFRLPVVITTTVEQFNAYYADSPYNRIVVYDTAQIEDLAVFSQTVLSTFKHELTHAVTYNVKNKAMRVVGKLFGDTVTSHYITVTSGMAEGATVSYESAEGEGRLNDAYALQMIRQAKIENKFPTYSDVKGAGDAYPRNSFYYFNGAFAQYLQKTFGMHKYAEFWYRCINTENLSDLTAGGAFKKTFGIKINRAWEMFKQALEVPQVSAADPVAAGISDDFFQSGKSKLSIKNKSGSLYSNLCTSQAGLAFIDDSDDTVYFYSDGKLKKLFIHDYIESINLSNDGRFLAVGYYTTASATIKHCAKIFDIQNKKWISVPGTNYSEPSVVFDGSKYYFVAQNYEPQRYSICVKELVVNGRTTKVSSSSLASRYFGIEEVPSDFTDLGNGRVAFVLKKSLDYSICVSDILLTNITEYPVPLERMKVCGLSAAGFNKTGEEQLLFSWATKETLPRLGSLDLSDGMFRLAQENISGGIYTPVEYNGHLYYTAKFYKDVKLLELVEKGPFDKLRDHVESERFLSLSKDSDHTPAETHTDPLPFKPFSPLHYTFEGLLLPVAGVNSSLMPGITYINSLPWYASLTILSGGYDSATKSGVFEFNYQSGTDTSLLVYSADTSFAVDKNGFKYFKGDLNASSGFDFGTISAVSFTAQANASYGRTLKDSMSVYFSHLQFASVAYSNITRTGPGTYEKGGISFASGVVHSYETQTKPKKELIIDTYDAEFDFTVCLPRLIPLTCVDNFTYNLPAKIKTFFFSLSSPQMRLARVNAEAVLFGYDIQKAVPGVSAIYSNDVVLSLGYTGGFDYLTVQEVDKNWHFLRTAEYAKQIKDGELPYKDYFTLKFSLGFTPNIGTFANPQARMNFYACCNFGKKKNLPEKVFDFGLETTF